MDQILNKIKAVDTENAQLSKQIQNLNKFNKM